MYPKRILTSVTYIMYAAYLTRRYGHNKIYYQLVWAVDILSKTSYLNKQPVKSKFVQPQIKLGETSCISNPLPAFLILRLRNYKSLLKTNGNQHNYVFLRVIIFDSNQFTIQIAMKQAWTQSRHWIYFVIQLLQLHWNRILVSSSEQYFDHYLKIEWVAS